MPEVTRDEARARYETVVEGATAYVSYRRAGNVLTLDHTVVPPALKGRGIGSALVRAVLDDVAERRLRVVPACGFVAAFIRRHPEDERLLAADLC